MRPPVAPPKIGDTLGEYTLESRLGAGGNATVFRALDSDGNTVALKVLHPGHLSDEDLGRFKREYEALQLVDHPQIVRVYQTGEMDGQRWLAMEYIEGVDLGTLTERWQTTPPKTAGRNPRRSSAGCVMP